MESKNEPPKLFKWIGTTSNDSRINDLWKIIRIAFTEVLNEDSIETAYPDESLYTITKSSKLSENILEGKLEKLESEARNTFVIVYYRCLSQASLSLDILGSINKFLLIYPKLLVDQLDFFAESLISQLQLEIKRSLRIAWADKVKLRYYLIQTLLIIAFRHGLDKDQLRKINEVLLRELNLTINSINVEWLSNWFELKEVQWIERKEKWSLIIEGYKCLSYIRPNNKKLYTRYALLYYIHRLMKISARENLAEICDRVYSNMYLMIKKNNLYISQMEFQEATDEEKEGKYIEILNEYSVIIKCFVRLLNALPDTHIQFKSYFKNEFKSTVAAHLLLIERIKSLEAKTIYKILHVLNSFLLITPKRFPNEEEFIVDNEVYNFYEHCNKLFSKDKLIEINKAVLEYFYYRRTKEEGIVRILNTKENVEGMTKIEILEMHLGFIRKIIYDEVTFLKVAINILDALTLLLVKVEDKERKEIIGRFIIELIGKGMEKLRDIEWVGEGIFIDRLMYFMKRICKDQIKICCEILRMITNSMKNPNEVMFRDHQGITCMNMKWTVLIDCLIISHSYSFALELLEFLKNLTYSNQLTQKKVENDLRTENRQLAQAIVTSILNAGTPSRELINNIKLIMLEISFESSFDLAKLLRIKKLFYFEEYVMILYKVMVNEEYLKLVFSDILEVLGIASCCYENRILIASVSLNSKFSQKFSPHY